MAEAITALPLLLETAHLWATEEELPWRADESGQAVVVQHAHRGTSFSVTHRHTTFEGSGADGRASEKSRHLRRHVEKCVWWGGHFSRRIVNFSSAIRQSSSWSMSWASISEIATAPDCGPRMGSPLRISAVRNQYHCPAS